MSTRADFYVGRGPTSRWVGSIGRDAFVDALEPYFEAVSDVEAYRAALGKVFEAYGEISARDGWPWPWSSSRETGTAVAFDEGQVWVSLHGQGWAPISAWDTPGEEACVFPDMAADECATAEGRLRRDLRLGTSIRLGPDIAVLPALLARLAYLLDRIWLHSHEAEGQLRMLTPQTQLHDQAFDLARVLQRHADTVCSLVQTQQEADGEPVWGLVAWACEHLRPYYGRDSVRVELTDELPVHFGQPVLRPHAGNIELPKALNLHVEPLDSGYRQGRDLLEPVLDWVPDVHALALAHEMKLHCILPVKADELETWLDTPSEDFGGTTLRSVCATAHGRTLANRMAARHMWTR